MNPNKTMKKKKKSHKTHHGSACHRVRPTPQGATSWPTTQTANAPARCGSPLRWAKSRTWDWR